jgi:hypothetical protein
MHLLLFFTMTNKCTIISQIITLLHVSTLSCHPQGTFNQYLVKLHQHVKCSISVIVRQSLNKHTRHIHDMTFVHPLMKSIFITDRIYGHRTDGLHKNCKNIMTLAYSIVNRIILIFKGFKH